MTFEEWWYNDAQAYLWQHNSSSGALRVWIAARAADTALLRAAREVLVNARWVYDGELADWFCPSCDTPKGKDHAPDCKYAAVLARLNERLGDADAAAGEWSAK